MSSSNQNPIKRITELTNNDLDYLDLKPEFQNLIELAKNITGLEISLLNLIDATNLWPISQSGIQLEVMPLKDTPCQFTITKDDYFEVKDLTNNEIFKQKKYVKEAPFYKYYLGVPLKTQSGINIGSLCFFDTRSKELDEKQIKLLKIIANEVVAKIEFIKTQNNLRKEFFEYRASQSIVANNLRNPLTGIISLSDVLIDQNEDIETNEVSDYNLLINKSSKSILSIFDDIIINQKRQETEVNTVNLNTLRERIINLYSPLLVAKQIKLEIIVNELKTNILFLKSNVIFLVGSLLVEALININDKGKLTITLDLIIKVDQFYIKAEFISDNLININNLEENEILKVYQNKLEELGGEIIFNTSLNHLYQITLPVKSV